jgi:hypothetical protein
MEPLIKWSTSHGPASFSIIFCSGAQQHVRPPYFPSLSLYLTRRPGGVLDGSWTFQTNRAFQPISSAPVKTPSQIIHRAARIRAAHPSPGEIPLDLRTEETLPLDRHLRHVICPTVFGGVNSQICRRLSLGELCNAFDVPTEMCPEALQQHLHVVV